METIGFGLRVVSHAHYERSGLIACARALETHNALARSGTFEVSEKVWRLRRLWEKVETFGFGLRVVPRAHYVRVGLIARA